MSARIDRLWPEPAEDLDDERIVATYAFPDDKAWLRVNFVSSLDGAATRDGRSGGLGDDADHRVFDLLRRPADVVLVGAGTVRTEGYGAMTLDDAAVAWRRERGLPPQPVLARGRGASTFSPAPRCSRMPRCARSSTPWRRPTRTGGPRCPRPPTSSTRARRRLTSRP